MKLINYAHPIPDTDLTKIAELADVQPQDITVQDIEVNLDWEGDFKEQVIGWVNQVGYSKREWQTERFIVRSASLSDVWAGILAEMHGLRGEFVPILHYKRQNGVYVPDAIINLQDWRNEARQRRFS